MIDHIKNGSANLIYESYVIIEKGWYTTKSKVVYKDNIIINGVFYIPEDVLNITIWSSILVGKSEYVTAGVNGLKKLILNSRKLTDEEVMIMDIIT